MTRAVCDSGPLTHLWQVDLWAAFGTFGHISLATQVAREVRRHAPLDQFERLAGCALSTCDVPQTDVASCRSTLPPQLELQDADVATLHLARKLGPDFVLTDDLDVRRAVESQRQTPMGSVGILMRAYKAGLLNAASLDRAIDRLFVHSTLYLSPAFKSHVKRQVAQLTALGRNPGAAD